MEQGKVEKLRQKIIADAEGEARKILQEGEAEAETITDEAKAEAGRIASESRIKADAEAKEHIRRQLSLRELEAKKAILAEKGKAIDSVFTKALDELRRRDREEGYKLTRDLLFKAIEVGEEEIIMSPEDRRVIGDSFLKKLNTELEKMGKKGQIKLSEETRDIRGGFILRKGRAETNASFEILLSVLRDEVETEVAGILFEKGEKAR